jgi:hypothetical protein
VTYIANTILAGYMRLEIFSSASAIRSANSEVGKAWPAADVGNSLQCGGGVER